MLCSVNLPRLGTTDRSINEQHLNGSDEFTSQYVHLLKEIFDQYFEFINYKFK